MLNRIIRMKNTWGRVVQGFLSNLAKSFVLKNVPLWPVFVLFSCNESSRRSFLGGRKVQIDFLPSKKVSYFHNFATVGSIKPAIILYSTARKGYHDMVTFSRSAMLLRSSSELTFFLASLGGLRSLTLGCICCCFGLLMRKIQLEAITRLNKTCESFFANLFLGLPTTTFVGAI